jgi:hypothetical protein
MLHEAVLPNGTRELRLSDWWEMVAGSPALVMRLIERPGLPATGEWIWVWAEHRAWGQRRRADRCTPWADSMRTCAIREVSGRTDWADVAARMNASGAWTLYERCETDGVHTSDAADLLIQRLTAADYTTYSCNNPGARASAPGLVAQQLFQYFRDLARQAVWPRP